LHEDYHRKLDPAYETDVYLFPRKLGEKVARLHLPVLGADLTELTRHRPITLALVPLDRSSQTPADIDMLSGRI